MCKWRKDSVADNSPTSRILTLIHPILRCITTLRNPSCLSPHVSDGAENSCPTELL